MTSIHAGSQVILKTRGRRWFDALSIVLLVACLEYVLVLFVSGGHGSDWPASSDFYDQQADAFLHGQSYLRQTPDPRLALLPNPYAKESRQGIDAPLDVSYYQGHYFLYWGPVPAAGVALVHAGARLVWEMIREQMRPASVIMGIRLLANFPIGDNQISFAAAAGIVLLVALILVRLRNQFFPNLKLWLLLGSISAVALGTPIVWMLNRPMIYEAAVLSGQMFFLAGLYVILPAFSSAQCGPLRYGCASFLWALALGSRLSLAGAVVAFVFAIAVIQFRGTLPRGRIFANLAGLGIPLLAGIVALGVFNAMRFGNPLESGFRYQLGALDYTQSQADVFAIRYAFYNFYNYFFRPATGQATFPFILPAGWNPLDYPFFQSRPALYYVEPVTGILLASPFVFSVGGLCRTWLPARKPREAGAPDATRSAHGSAPAGFRVVSFGLLAAACLAFLPLAGYWYCTERFVMDFEPLILILAACGAWNLYSVSVTFGRWRFLAAGWIAGSILWTVLSNVLLGVTGYGSHW
jgi:hypothetical protein